MSRAAFCLVLFLSGCSLPTGPQDRYSWEGNWVKSPLGEYVWDGVEMRWEG